MATVLFNKPYGVVCQFSPCGEHQTLASFELPPGVYAAGRLDRDSEGLLLLTSDGGLQHALTDPRFHHPKTYWAQVERVPSAEKLAKLARGVRLKDGMTRPCTVRLLAAEPDVPLRIPPVRFRKTVPTAWLEITLTEGRNRQIRRMGSAIGHPVLRLLRCRIGDLTLKGIFSGRWRPLYKGELARLVPAAQRAAALRPPVKASSRTVSSSKRRSPSRRS